MVIIDKAERDELLASGAIYPMDDCFDHFSESSEYYGNEDGELLVYFPGPDFPLLLV